MESGNRIRVGPQLGPLFDRMGLDSVRICVATGMSPHTVIAWRSGYRRVSPDTALLLEREFGVPREEIRPDLWGSRAEQSEAKSGAEAA